MKQIFKQRASSKWFVLMRIATPLVVAVTLLTLFINSMHYGGVRESLASKAEAELINLSLLISIQDTNNDSVVISVKDEDLEYVRRAPSSSLKDAAISEYAKILNSVLKSNPRHVFISWLAGAHSLNKKYLRSVLAVIDTHQAHERVTIALPLSISGKVSEELAQNYDIIDGDDCVYEVNRFCSYLPNYGWVIYRVTQKARYQIPKHAVSTNMPHKSPNFLLNLPTRNSLAELSFRDIALNGVSSAHFGKTFFIGNDTAQKLKFQNSKYVLQRTFTVESDSKGTLLYSGQPFHVFWAQIGQMASNNDYVGITSKTRTIASAIILCCLILFGFKLLGTSGAFAVWAVCLFWFPLFNGFIIRYYGWYVPQFGILFSGFMFFLVITFLLQSVNIYNQSKSYSRARAFSDVAEVKGNFISLISHNLNTPIAQIVGLLDILVASPQHISDIKVMEKSIRLISQIHLCVRSVLLSTAIDQGNLGIGQCTLASLIDRFDKDNMSALQKIGYEVEIIQTDEFGGIAIDEKIFRHILSCSIALFPSEPGSKASIKVKAAIRSQRGLVVTISGTAPPQNANTDFLSKSISQYLDVATSKFSGKWAIEGSRITLAIPSAKP